MNTLKLTAPSLPRPLRKLTLWTTALILSLALALSPPQTSFAKNTPVQSPAEIGISNNGGGNGTATGVIDGGPGAGDVERITAVIGKGKSKSKNPIASVYNGGESDDGGGATGVTFFEWTSFGYYHTIFEQLKTYLFLDWNLTSTPTPSDYEN